MSPNWGGGGMKLIQKLNVSMEHGSGAQRKKYWIQDKNEPKRSAINKYCKYGDSTA